jgi:hypothetical protein
MRSLEIVYTKKTPDEPLLNFYVALWIREWESGGLKRIRLVDIKNANVKMEPEGILTAELEHLNGIREICEVFSMRTATLFDPEPGYFPGGGF